MVFLGSSGVGKSTLVNALAGYERAATGGIREDDDKGRHTTTSRQLHLMAEGYAVLDNPGMREVQLTDAAEGIAELFADLTELAGECRFSDCRHENEPAAPSRRRWPRGGSMRHGSIAGASSRRRMPSTRRAWPSGASESAPLDAWCAAS